MNPVWISLFAVFVSLAAVFIFVSNNKKKGGN